MDVDTHRNNPNAQALAQKQKQACLYKHKPRPGIPDHDDDDEDGRALPTFPRMMSFKKPEDNGWFGLICFECDLKECDQTTTALLSSCTLNLIWSLCMIDSTRAAVIVLEAFRCCKACMSMSKPVTA